MTSLAGFAFNSSYSSQYERAFMLSRGALKLSETEKELCIGVVEDSTPELRHFLEGFHLPKKVQFKIVEKAEFAAFIGSTTEYEGENDQQKNNGFVLESVEQDAPVINLINGFCIDAVKMGASDIHLEAQRESVQVRYRIDGMLRLVKRLEPGIFQQLSNRIKVMAGLNTLELRLPQDGRITVIIEGKRKDMRVSIVPVTDGESIVLRLFQEAEEVFSLDDLGFHIDDLKALRQAVKLPYGLVMFSGPTGSGKTTTLHALLSELPSMERKIITIEDPVEQYVPGINQIQINEAINLNFDGMLRRVLRQDPDVIMVGEIRDEATAELALRSSLTGHLILSTLHTNDSAGIITRLTDMGIAPYLTAASLRYCSAQRLVRRLCKKCNGKGCNFCGGSGFRGRSVIGEVFCVDEEIRFLIGKEKTADEIRKVLIKKGMKTLFERGMEKVKKGITTREELEREALI
ncbi:MAG: GspE/PulE family protein [Treponema sp.]|nr:GspE/PulE family protein [Treponema sp.]